MNKLILFGTYTLNMGQSLTVLGCLRSGTVITDAKIKLWNYDLFAVWQEFRSCTSYYKLQDIQSYSVTRLLITCSWVSVWGYTLYLYGKLWLSVGSQRLTVSHRYSRCGVLKLPRRPPTAGCWCLSHRWRSDDCYHAGRQRWSHGCCDRHTHGSEPEEKS